MLKTNLEENLIQYKDHYNKPSWWFKYQYCTRIKTQTCLFLIDKICNKWQDKKIFEIGFGHGEVLFSFSHDNFLIGSEISVTAITRAQERAKKRMVLNSDFFSIIDEPDISKRVSDVDLVVASHVLEHVDDDISLLQTIIKILKPSGYLVLLVPINESIRDPKHVRMYSYQMLLDLALSVGFVPLYGLQNDYLFTILETIYWGRNKGFRGIIYRILWKLLNALFGVWPFSFYRKIDNVSIKFFNGYPHQSGLLLQRPDTTNF